MSPSHKGGRALLVYGLLAVWLAVASSDWCESAPPSIPAKSAESDTLDDEAPFTDSAFDSQTGAPAGAVSDPSDGTNGSNNPPPLETVSGNPAATNIQTGSGWLGNRLGINRNGFRFAGLNITDANGQLTGGVQPGQWTGDSLTILDFSLDTEKSFGWQGGLLGMEFLYYGGATVNSNAGTVMGYNSLDTTAPRTRTQIYQLWYRQALFDNKLIVRLGKSVPTCDFNNVVRSIPFSEQARNIPSVTSAIFTPAYVSPTQLGIMPGYYNSATGLVLSLIPNDNFYAQYGVYDGNLAAGRETGLTGPEFNGYYLHVLEGGGNWTIGQQRKPGKCGAGCWQQTGSLAAAGGNVNSATGMYVFGSQRLYYERPGVSNRGLSMWSQFAATDSEFVRTHRYVGCGLTYFGSLAGRNNDSMGFGVAYGKMSNNPALALGSQETIFTWYYQANLKDNIFVQPNLTYISTPAERPGLNDVFAITMRFVLLF